MAEGENRTRASGTAMFVRIVFRCCRMIIKHANLLYDSRVAWGAQSMVGSDMAYWLVMDPPPRCPPTDVSRVCSQLPSTQHSFAPGAMCLSENRIFRSRWFPRFNWCGQWNGIASWGGTTRPFSGKIASSIEDLRDCRSCSVRAWKALRRLGAVWNFVKLGYPRAQICRIYRI